MNCHICSLLSLPSLRRRKKSEGEGRGFNRKRLQTGKKKQGKRNLSSSHARRQALLLPGMRTGMNMYMIFSPSLLSCFMQISSFSSSTCFFLSPFRLCQEEEEGGWKKMIFSLPPSLARFPVDATNIFNPYRASSKSNELIIQEIGSEGLRSLPSVPGTRCVSRGYMMCVHAYNLLRA